MAASPETLTSALAYFEENRGTFPRAVVPLLHEKFQLTPMEVISIISEANRRMEAKNVGTS